jgi:ABC-2 type transport system ATP-binding protein
VDAPEFEVKDTIELIDYLAGRPEIQQDAPGDPHAGWIGGSYAGGIQLNTSAFDHRVDALVPEIPWANLLQDLYPNEVVKRSWDQLLYGAGAASATTEGIGSPAGPQTGVYAEQIHQAQAEGSATGTFSQDIQDWFYDKSTVIRSDKITVPTMIMQGTVDTLFPLEDGFANYANLLKAGVPAKLVTFCGGHTLGCNYPGGATGHPKGNSEVDHYDDMIVAWLDRYVKGDASVDVGPALEWEAQTGHYYGAKRFPVPGTKNVRAKAFKTGTLAGPGSSGGDQAASGAPAPDSELGSSAVRKRVLGKHKRPLAVVGIPKVRLKGTLTGADGGYVFAELVDKAPNGDLVTVDDQTMPLKVAAGDVKTTLALHGVTWLVKPKHTLLLEITTGSTEFDTARTGPYTIDLKARAKLLVSRRGAKAARRTT